MYTVTKKVYYCDFCRKYKLTPQATRVHELHCTLNPNRECRMPGCGDGSYTNGPCPNCRLAEARLSGAEYEGDYQADLRGWWQGYRQWEEAAGVDFLMYGDGRCVGVS